MLFWVTLLLVIVGAVLYYKFENNYDREIVCLFGGVLTFVGSIILAIMVLIMLFSYIGVDSQYKAIMSDQQALEYKINSGLYQDDLGMLDKDVITEVKEWNHDVIMNKEYQRNFWVGIFVPNIYDDVNVIDYKRIK